MSDAISHSDLQAAVSGVKAAVDELDGKLDDHLRHAAVQDSRLQDLMGLNARVRDLEDWRVEMLTIGRMVKWAVGGSLIAAVVSLLNFAALVGGR